MRTISLEDYICNQNEVISVVENDYDFMVGKVLNEIEIEVEEDYYNQNIYFAFTSEFDYQTTNIFDLIRMYNDLSEEEKEDLTIVVNGERVNYFD